MLAGCAENGTGFGELIMSHRKPSWRNWTKTLTKRAGSVKVLIMSSVLYRKVASIYTGESDQDGVGGEQYSREDSRSREEPQGDAAESGAHHENSAGTQWKN